ncbi:unnamed protein product [Absidia cylindrospora]
MTIWCLMKKRAILVKELLTIHSTDNTDDDFSEFLKSGDTRNLDMAIWDSFWMHDELLRTLTMKGISLTGLDHHFFSMDMDPLERRVMADEKYTGLESHVNPMEMGPLELLAMVSQKDTDLKSHVRPMEMNHLEIHTMATQDLRSTWIEVDIEPMKMENQIIYQKQPYEVRNAISTESSALTPISQPAQRTMIPIIPSTDSALVPVRTYNNLRLDTNGSYNGADNAGSLDLYDWFLKTKHRSLSKALDTSVKVLTTHDWNVAQNESKAIKTLQRIEHLKSTNMWSFKQLRRHTSVPRTKTHWDFMLEEMRWMRTDFKEERKWKIATAYMISRAVVEWHDTSDKPSSSAAHQHIPVSTTTDAPIHASTTVLMDTPPATTTDTTSENIVGQQQSEHHAISISSNNDDTNINDSTAAELEMERTANLFSMNNSFGASELCQRLIVECDRSSTIVTLPENSNRNLNNITSLLPYEPPDPNAIDPYFNEVEYGRIVPITKLLSSKKRGLRKRTIDGQSTSLRKPMDDYKVNILPNSERYDLTQSVPSLFAPPSPSSTPSSPSPPPSPSSSPTSPSLPPSPSPYPYPSVLSSGSGVRSYDHWTEDDDLCLISLIMQFSFNWDLICNAFNSIRAPLVSGKRTPWELYEHWRQNNLTTLSGEVNQDYAIKLENYLSKPPSIVKFDSLRKKQRQYGIFEAIKKHRKEGKENQGPTDNASTPWRTIETHGMSSYGNRLPTATELSLEKAQRELHQKLARLQRRSKSEAPRKIAPVIHQVRYPSCPPPPPPPPPTATSGSPKMQNTTSATTTPIMTNRTNTVEFPSLARYPMDTINNN